MKTQLLAFAILFRRRFTTSELGVVDRERRPSRTAALIPDGSRSSASRWPRRLLVVAAGLTGGEEHGGSGLVLDQRQVGQVELEGRSELVEQQRRHLHRLGCVEQALRDQAVAGGLVLPRRAALSVENGRHGRERHGGEQNRGQRECCPRVARARSAPPLRGSRAAKPRLGKMSQILSSGSSGRRRSRHGADAIAPPTAR